jgi:hypothetical protein
MQLLSALDQMVGLLWVSLLVSGALVACCLAAYGTGELAARRYRGDAKTFRDWLRKLGRAIRDQRS